MPEIQIQAADGKKERVALAKARITIGRSRDSDIFLPDQWLSRHHAEIRQKGDAFFLADLGSKNGTLLNGAKIDDAQRLRAGDVITLGEHVLTFTLDADEEDYDDAQLLGTRVFSVRELSDVATKPVQAPEELLKQNRILTVLSRAARALIEHKPLGELFDLILNLLFDAVPAERAAILLIEGHPPHPTIKASRNRSGGQAIRVSRSIARRVIDQRAVLLLPNVMEDASLRSQDSILATGIRSALCAPLWFLSDRSDQDQVIGLVYLDSLQKTHSFSEEDVRIVSAIANVAAAKIENARLLEESLEKRRLEEDLRVASQIQRSLLPAAAPVVPGWSVTGSNSPCRAIGGDYYDYSLEGAQLLLALGDVAGKGSGAALVMAVLRAAVRSNWSEGSTAEAIVRINRIICQNVPDGKYVTFFMARLDHASGRLAYVNAGHNAPLLVRADGAVEQLEDGGPVLGVFDSAPYSEGVVTLRPADTLLIFSDGITETFNADGEEFGDAGLRTLAVKHRTEDAQTLEGTILAELERFASGAKATDDRTLIVLKRR